MIQVTWGLYYYNPETGKFELVNAKVIVKDGYATFEIEHCSDYVLSKVDLTKTAETETKAAETVAGAVAFSRKKNAR